jgi:hypothetical protein
VRVSILLIDVIFNISTLTDKYAVYLSVTSFKYLSNVCYQCDMQGQTEKSSLVKEIAKDHNILF